MRHLRTRTIGRHFAWAALGIGLGASVAAAIGDCVDYLSDNAQIVSDYGSGSSTAVAVSADRAYAAVSGGIRVFDLSGPGHPTPLGVLPVSGYVGDLTIDAGHLYICTGSFGLRIASIAGGGVPSIVAEVPLTDGAYDVSVNEGVAVVAAGAAGLVFYDVSDAAHPLPLASAGGGAAVYQLARSGNQIYGGCRTAGVVAVNADDPAHPVTGALLALDAYVTCLGVHDGGLYVGTYDARVLSFDLTSPASPALLGELVLPDFPTSMASLDGTLWLSAMQTGLIAVDTSAPANPAVGDLVEIPGSAVDTEHAAGLTVVAGTNELRVLDLASPTPDATLGWYHAPNGLSDMAVAGNRGYALDHFEGLLTLDLSDPHHPVEIDRLALPGTNNAITLVGDHAFVAAHTAGIRVLDLTDPDQPVLTATVPLSGTVWDVAVSGDRLVVSLDDGALGRVVVLDASDWRLPVQVGSAVVAYPRALAAAGTTAIVVSNGALMIVEFSQPSTPSVAGGWPTSNVTGLAISGTDVFFCESSGALTILDVSNPAAPFAVGGCATASWTCDLSLADGLAYLASQDCGVLAVDISDPTQPVYIGAAATAGSAEQVFVAGNAIYAATADQGLAVTGPACVATTSGVIPGAGTKLVLSAHPNPFNPRTAIAFELNAPTVASVTIVDLGGRVVRTLLKQEALGTGTHSLTWDGLDDRGRTLAAGLYMARLMTGNGTSHVKVTMLK